MLQAEAIQIVGAEQMSAYTGYAWTLRYSGDFVDTSARDSDGTVMNGIARISQFHSSKLLSKFAGRLFTFSKIE